MSKTGIVEAADGQDERAVLYAMLTDQTVLARVAAKWERNLLGAGWMSEVARHAVGYYGKHGTPPGRLIRNELKGWLKRVPESVGEAVAGFVRGLDDYAKAAPPDPTGLVELAERVFNLAKVDALIEDLKQAIANNDTTAVKNKLDAHRPVVLKPEDGIKVMTDAAAVERTLAVPAGGLFRLKGDVGEFCGNVFERQAFVCLFGVEKSGKSYMLMDLCHAALMTAKLKVAMFQCGDLSESDTLKRWYARLLNRPVEAGTYQYPTGLRRSSGGVEVDTEERCQPARMAQIPTVAALDKKMRAVFKTKFDPLRLVVRPSGTLTVPEAELVIQGWRADGFKPDVVCFDYADILACSNPRLDKRDQINDVWLKLRSLAIKYDCLVLTASQAKAKAYGIQTLMDMSHFSDDKRKLAHATAVMGLNATTEESDQQVMRLNWIVRRNAKANSKRAVYAAGCREEAKVLIHSVWAEKP